MKTTEAQAIRKELAGIRELLSKMLAVQIMSVLPETSASDLLGVLNTPVTAGQDAAEFQYV